MQDNKIHVFSAEFEVQESSEYGGAITTFEWELPQSNKIAGAFLWSRKLVKENSVDKEIIPLFAQKKIAFSSFFPYIDRDNFLLPKPPIINLLLPDYDDEDKGIDYGKQKDDTSTESGISRRRFDEKEVKRAKFITFGAFNNFLRSLDETKLEGDDLIDNLTKDKNLRKKLKDFFESIVVENNTIFLKSEFSRVSKKDFNALPREILLIRNSIDRNSWTVREGILINEKIVSAKRIYFLFASSEENIKEFIIPSLKFVCEWGISSGKTIGRGAIKLKRIRKVKINPLLKNFVFNLSLILPTNEFDLEKSFYSVKFYRGKVYFPDIRVKKGLLVIGEGAILRTRNGLQNFSDGFSICGQLIEDSEMEIWGEKIKIYSIFTGICINGEIEFGEEIGF